MGIPTTIDEVGAREVERKGLFVTILVVMTIVIGIALYGYICDVQQKAWQMRFLAAYDSALIDESRSMPKEWSNPQKVFNLYPTLRRLNRTRQELGEAQAVQCCSYDGPDSLIVIAWLKAQDRAWDRAVQQVPMPWPLSSLGDGKPAIR